MNPSRNDILADEIETAATTELIALERIAANEVNEEQSITCTCEHTPCDLNPTLISFTIQLQLHRLESIMKSNAIYDLIHRRGKPLLLRHTISSNSISIWFRRLTAIAWQNIIPIMFILLQTKPQKHIVNYMKHTLDIRLSSLILKTALAWCCRLHFEFINYPHSVNRGFHLTSRLVTLGWLFFSDKSNMNRYNIFREPCY